MSTTSTRSDLMRDFSLEMTGKDIPGLLEAAPILPQGSKMNVTFLGNEDLEMRLAAAKAVKEQGLTPVPHISARRIKSEAMLDEFLSALADQGTVEKVFAVSGDPATPEGPYQDALALIESGLFEKYGVREVSVGGYPEGHPEISKEVLWNATIDKAAALKERGMDGVIITQFGFDVTPVLDWAEKVREAGIDNPIRVGVPGPAGIKRLLAFAARFGVASSAGIAKKYGFSITNLLGTAGPNKFIDELAKRHDPALHGVLQLHYYTFGGVPSTAEWIQQFQAGKFDK